MAERPGFHHKQLAKPEVTPRLKLAGRIKLAGLLELDEKGFRGHVRSVEHSPLFERLFRPGDSSQRVITYARPYRLKLSDSFLGINDEIAASSEALDVQSLVFKRDGAARTIKKIGEANFKKFFLFDEAGAGAEEIAASCGISADEARGVIELVDELTAHSEFYGKSNIAPEKSIIYNKIAGIDKDGDGKYAIIYNSPHLAKGRYSIDYDKLELLRKSGVFGKHEAWQLDTLINHLERINLRKSVIHRVLESVIEFQKEYLETGEKGALVPLSQKTVSARLEVSPSVVNRALYARSVSMPCGKEAALREFFPSKKDVIKSLLGGIIAAEKQHVSDEQVSVIMMDRHGMKVSRHLVQIYRHELGIPPANKRKGAESKVKGKG